MKKRLSLNYLSALFIASVLILGLPATASAQAIFNGQKDVVRPGQIGNDVSWPQCGSPLPTGQSFGIIGVNDGLANTTNPCFATEFAWANSSLGSFNQPKVSLYVNTANPGNLNVADWPTTGMTPFGSCNGTDNQACAYQYGWNKAEADALSRGVVKPCHYTWWLDVENDNSWESNTVNNTSDLTGMTAYFESIGARVGIYSDTSEWVQITGNVSPSSRLYDLPDWVLGAHNLSEAESNCYLKSFTIGGQVALAQYVSGQFDFDYSCSL